MYYYRHWLRWEGPLPPSSSFSLFLSIMLGIGKRAMATMAAQTASLKKAGKVVCIGRNYA